MTASVGAPGRCIEPVGEGTAVLVLLVPLVPALRLLKGLNLFILTECGDQGKRKRRKGEGRKKAIYLQRRNGPRGLLHEAILGLHSGDRILSYSYSDQQTGE